MLHTHTQAPECSKGEESCVSQCPRPFKGTCSPAFLGGSGVWPTPECFAVGLAALHLLGARAAAALVELLQIP